MLVYINEISYPFLADFTAKLQRLAVSKYIHSPSPRMKIHVIRAVRSPVKKFIVSYFAKRKIHKRNQHV